MIVYSANHRDIQEAIDKTTDALLKTENTINKDILREHLKVLHKIQQSALTMLITSKAQI